MIDTIKQLLSFTDIIPIHKKEIIKALNSEFNNFEDALQNYAAELSETNEMILTSNTKDYTRSNLVVLSPDLFIKMLRAF